ncbi:hypothetical protein Esti_001077 [Eimeria stiedai]
MDQSRDAQSSFGETRGEGTGALGSTGLDSGASGSDQVSAQQSSFLGPQKPLSVQEGGGPKDDEVPLPPTLPDIPCRGREAPLRYAVKRWLTKLISFLAAVAAASSGSKRLAGFLGPAASPVVAASPLVDPRVVQDGENGLPRPLEEIEGSETGSDSSKGACTADRIARRQ